MQGSVIVSTFNRRDLVLRSIRTLMDQDFPADRYEIVVVVDGSTDGTASALRELRPSCGYRIIEQLNRGLAGARNTGWRTSDRDLLIFLDDDMLCDPSLVRAHFEAHTQSESTIGVGTVLLSPDSHQTVAAACFNREVGSYALSPESAGHPLPISTCIFGNTSIRRSWMIKSGGFDERFRMREDAEIATRLVRLGAQPRFVPQAAAYQLYTKTASDLIRDSEAFAAADVLFMREHPADATETFAGKIAVEPKWKRSARRIAASVPTLTDAFATPVCWLGNTLPTLPLLRNLAVRALQFQRGIHYYRRVLQLQKEQAS